MEYYFNLLVGPKNHIIINYFKSAIKVATNTIAHFFVITMLLQDFPKKENYFLKFLQGRTLIIPILLNFTTLLCVFQLELEFKYTKTAPSCCNPFT